MMEEKPTAGFVLSLIGGIFVLLGGLSWAALGTLTGFFFGVGFLLYAFVIFGVIMIVGAAMMYNAPGSAKAWGIVILILGVFSLIGVITALGGILAIIGGALAIGWKPPSVGVERITRICPQCGRVIAEDLKYCPYCGKQLG